MSNTQEKSEWITIAAAAASAELPVRSVYNWVKSGSIDSRKVEGVAHVRMGEVLAKASARALGPRRGQPLPARPAQARQPASAAGMGASGQPAVFERMDELVPRLEARCEQREARLAKDIEANASWTGLLDELMRGAVEPAQAELEEQMAQTKAELAIMQKRLYAALLELDARMDARAR